MTINDINETNNAKIIESNNLYFRSKEHIKYTLFIY